MNPMKKKNVPWWVWLAVTAAVLVFLVPIARDDRVYVHVVGSGTLALLTRADAPEGVKLRLRTKMHEAPAETAKRVEKVLQVWPDTVIIGFDGSQLRTHGGSIQMAQRIVRKVVTKAGQSDSDVYMIGFVPAPGATQEAIAATAVANEWWTEEICSDSRIRCIAPPPHIDEPEEARAAIRDAIEAALAGDGLELDAPEAAPSGDEVPRT